MADLSAVVTARYYGRSPIGAVSNVLVATLSELVHAAADTVSRIWNESGDVAFVASPDHDILLYYEARLRVYGNSTVVATAYLGKQTPDGNNVIIHPLAAWFAGRTPGTYTVSVAACDADESADSSESPPFTIPIPGVAERIAVGESVQAVRV